MLRQLSGTLLGEYRRYLPVVDGSGLPGERSAQFYHIYQILRRAEDSEELRSCLKDSVSVLCQMLEDIYQKKVYLFLDEYDTPFLSASEKGYYDAVRDVLSGLMSAALKGNPSLEKALLTGIQRVAKENIFSGLNHLMVCTVRDSEYGDCFGFTEDEVRALLAIRISIVYGRGQSHVRRLSDRRRGALQSMVDLLLRRQEKVGALLGGHQ